MLSARCHRRWLLPTVVLAMIASSNNLAASGPEVADSGWVVGQPSALGKENEPARPSLPIVTSHVLDESESLLSRSAPQAPSEEQEPRDKQTGREEYLDSKEPVDSAGKETESPPAGPLLAQPADTGLSATPTTDDRNGKPTTPGNPKVPEQSEVAGQQSGEDRAAAIDDRGAEAVTSNLPDDGEPQAASAPALPPLSQQMMSLRNRLRTVLKSYYRQPLNTRDNTPWEIMHAMLAYELNSRVLIDGPRGKPITSIGWLCYNKPCKGQQMLHLTPEGELRALYGVGLEGHGGQFLSMLAQCGVSPDYPIIVEGRKFTVQDLIATEQKTCYPGTELSFKLIALTQYVDLDDTWVNDKGETWDFPRLVREELAQPINGVACGGTHRLIGLSMAVRACRRQGKPLVGEYAQAAERVAGYQQTAFRHQNRDGSLSTDWFRGPGDDPDVARRVKTTGHQLEWLAYSLSDQQLRDGRMVLAVSYLTNLLYSNYEDEDEWDIGAVSHAIHSLALYDERVFQPYDQQPGVASSAKAKKTTRTYSRSSSNSSSRR